MDNGLSRLGINLKYLSRPVLILIVMDNGLSRFTMPIKGAKAKVLILIVMDNGLSPIDCQSLSAENCLNPYCNG